MIINALLDIVFALVNVVLSPLSVLNWTFNLSFLSPIEDILKVVFYVLPIGKLTPIILFIVAMFIFRAIISLIKTIWDIIPIL